MSCWYVREATAHFCSSFRHLTFLTDVWWLRERPKDDMTTPLIFMAFDCLWLASCDFREQWPSSRRAG